MRVFGYIVLFLTVTFLIRVLSGGCAMVDEVVTVAQKEFGPSAALRKYNEFKDIHSRLSSLKATIETLEQSLTTQKQIYGPDPSNWPRDVRQNFASSQIEISGTKARFNQLAADYNSKMASFNYAFANVGTLPSGAFEPLPREYVVYLTK